MIDSLRELIARCRSFFRKRERDEDLDAELSSHLDFSIQDNVRRGMFPAEASRRALVSFGGVEQARELRRDSRGLPALDAVLQDFRYGVRTDRIPDDAPTGEPVGLREAFCGAAARWVCPVRADFGVARDLWGSSRIR